jgi:HrpA-like RNA helicase
VSSPHTSKLSFHTDALELVRQLVSSDVPEILFLDEVHNFSIPTEILAMLAKNRRNTKLIIMSATLNPEIFKQYYKQIDSDIPVVEIPGRTFPVEMKFEDGSNGFDSVKKHFLEKKNILIFAPGKKEIEHIIETLRTEI